MKFLDADHCRDVAGLCHARGWEMTPDQVRKLAQDVLAHVRASMEMMGGKPPEDDEALWFLIWKATREMEL
jgi:aldehyde:ferredoxin oxidoreductase